MGTIKLQLGGNPPQQNCLNSLENKKSKCSPTLSYFPNSDNEDSIIDSINTGFGEQNTLTKECFKPSFKSHLFKENFLGEFQTDFEKSLARKNIKACGELEVKEIISHVISKTEFLSKKDVLNMIEDLGHVTALHSRNIYYDIPNELL